MPRPLLFIIVVFAEYVLFKLPGWLAGKPIPSSLVAMYMFFAVVTTLLVFTSTKEGTERLFSPLKNIFDDPKKSGIRKVVFAAAPLLGAIAAYLLTAQSYEPPAELRVVHPAPPASFSAFGKTFDTATLENPYRRLQKEDPARFKELVNEGGGVYFKNCFYCHGAKLDGRGHYAQALNPPSLPFAGKDTIAQMKESFIFWRIAAGGPGLPRESSPGASSMPVWHETMTEDEAWKVILFIYDYTGNVPRS